MRGPLNWLKKVPGWTKTVIGFIGVIAAFIVAFRENWYLYITVTIILILIYVLGVSIYVISERKPSKSKKKKWIYKYEKQRPWGFIGLAVFCLSTLGLLVAQPTRQIALYAFIGTPTPTPPPQLESADVLIAEFDSRYASRTMDVAHRLEIDLEDRLRSFGMEDVNVQVLAQPVASEAEAQTVVNDTGSRVVIWGWYDDVGIQVRVFLSGGEQAGSELPGTHEIPLALSGEDSSEISFVVQDVLPENVSFLSLFVIGHLEYLANNFEAGHRAFDAAMNNMPATVEIENESILHFFQARQLDAAGAELKDVICEYAKAIQSDPGFAEPYNNLGVVLSRLYEDNVLVSDIPSQARACLREAGLAGESDLYPADLYRRASDINPGLTVAEYNQAAFDWRNSYYYYGEDIVGTFERIQAKDPSIVGTYIILGIIMEQTEDDAGAIEMYEGGTKIQPDNLILHFNLGQLYLSHEKDEKKAEKEFQTVLSIDPDDLEAHLALGNLYYGQDKLAEASAQLAVVTESTGPDEGQSSVYWDARVLETAILFSQNKTTQAIQDLEEMVQATTRAPLELFLLGLLHQSMGENQEALERFQAAYEQHGLPNPTSHSTWIKIMDMCYYREDVSSGTFEDWAMDEFPDSDCLPAGTQQRIEAIYDIFHTFVLDRRIMPTYVEEGMACPYVYAYDPETGEWTFQTIILYQMVNREDVQMRPLKEFDGRLLIREEEREISYINQLYVLAILSNGTAQTLVSPIDELRHRDTDYVVLHQGEQIMIPLAGYPISADVDQWWVVATGYYEPISPLGSSN
jgi:tetratricopeptide (TPR) repeat protein